jgi:hypothetical protein
MLKIMISKVQVSVYKCYVEYKVCTHPPALLEGKDFPTSKTHLKREDTKSRLILIMPVCSITTDAL